MLIALLSFAFAQAPSSGLPPLLPMPGLSAPSSADTRWVVADTPSQRFPGEEVPGPVFTAGTEVQVIVTEGDRVRVFHDDKYGWVPATALASVPPIPEVPATPGLLGMPPQQPAPASPGAAPAAGG